MTFETRATIQICDILAIEYECPKCRAKSVRPIVDPSNREGRSNAIPRACGNCNALWIPENSQVEQDLRELLNSIGEFRSEGERLPFAMRFEIFVPENNAESGAVGAQKV